MRRTNGSTGRLVLVAALAWAGRVTATDVPLPAGANGILHCASAAACAADVRALLLVTGTHTPTLGLARWAADIRSAYGLPLLEPAQLPAAGVAAQAGWTRFEHEQTPFLAVTVSDPAKFAAAMTAWATERGLPHRERVVERGTTGELAARSEGARAVAGWVLRRGLAVVLLGPGSRAGLVGALRAFEHAVPAAAPMTGTFVSWTRGGALVPGVSPRETWTSLRLSNAGVEWTARLSGVPPGAFGAADAAWLEETFRTGGAGVRLRATFGKGGAGALAEAVAGRLPFASEDARWAWQAAFAEQAAGRVEVVVAQVDPNAIDLKDDSPDLLKLGPPWLLLPERADADELFALSRRSLARPIPFGAETLRVGQKATRATVVRRGTTFGVGLGMHGRPPESLGVAGVARTCAKGEPVAALRFDAPRLAAGLDEVSVFSALRGGGALGAYAAGAEFGSLLRATSRADAIACRVDPTTVEIAGAWRVAAPR